MGSNQVNITIDEAAARRDVQRIQGAMQALYQAKDEQLGNLIAHSGFGGLF